MSRFEIVLIVMVFSIVLGLTLAILLSNGIYKIRISRQEKDKEKDGN